MMDDFPPFDMVKKKKQQQLLTETQTAPHSETCDELFPLTLGYYPLAIYLGMYIYI